MEAEEGPGAGAGGSGVRCEMRREGEPGWVVAVASSFVSWQITSHRTASNWEEEGRTNENPFNSRSTHFVAKTWKREDMSTLSVEAVEKADSNEPICEKREIIDSGSRAKSILFVSH